MAEGATDNKITETCATKEKGVNATPGEMETLTALGAVYMLLLSSRDSCALPRWPVAG